MACVDSHASDAGLGAISPGLSLDALTDGRKPCLCFVILPMRFTREAALS